MKLIEQEQLLDSSEVNDLVTFKKLKTVFAALKMELFDLSVFNTLALHNSYKEFRMKYLAKYQQTGAK